MLLLKRELLNILKECLNHYNKELLWVIENENIVQIDKSLGNALQEAVGNELMNFGFTGDIPNQYGLQLESLIDSIGRTFM